MSRTGAVGVPCDFDFILKTRQNRGFEAKNCS